MNIDPSTTDFKKDELYLTSGASEGEKPTGKKTPSENIYEMTSCSSIDEISDALSIEPENHSEALKIFVVTGRYKITLEQARRMAINAAKRAKKRRERVLKQESDIETGG